MMMNDIRLLVFSLIDFELNCVCRLVQLGF